MRGLPRTLVYRLVFLLLGIALLLLLINSLLREGATFSQVLRQALRDCAPVILCGIGMTGIILAGAIDLSIGGVVALSGTVFGVCVFWGLSPLSCFAACTATAWFLCVVNGALVRVLGIPSIIVTLAGLTIYRGVALIVADLSIEDFSGNISIHAPSFHLPGRDCAAWILIPIVGLGLVWEAFSETSRRWLALGNSEEACRLQGLFPGRVLQSAFLVGGFFIGFGCLIDVTQVQAVEPARMALGFELQVIAAVVLGGTNIFGGEGCYAGTVLGAVFLYFTEQAMIYAGVSPYLQDVVMGGAILLIIGLDCFLHKRGKLLEELR